MDSSPLLDGVTVLDLSSVGPAARASRWLADYGARVIKVGPTAPRGGVQIEPPFFSYGAGRGIERVRIDLKTEGLDLGARLAARKGISLGAGTLSSLVKVQGTLAEPQLGTDLTGIVNTGAKVGIAVATVGLSLVAESVYGHITQDDYPCQTALARQIEVTPSDYRAQQTSDQN